MLEVTLSCSLFNILLSIRQQAIVKLVEKSGLEKKGMCRRSNTGFGIWDLPQKGSTMGKFGTLGLNWDFFGTIFIPFWDF